MVKAVSENVNGSVNGEAHIECMTYNDLEDGSGLYRIPESIEHFYRNGELFRHTRLYSTFSLFVRTYVLRDLTKEDNGTVFQCGIRFHLSMPITLSVFCEWRERGGGG